MTRLRGLAVGLAVAVLTGTSFQAPVAAQSGAASSTAAKSVESLSNACLTSGGTPLRCLEAAVAARTVLAQTGLAAGLGGEVPGNASTLGKRIGSTPRLAFALHGGGMQLRLPDLPNAVGGTPAAETSMFLPMLQGTFAIGVFEGFSPAPTVRGLLSVDLVARSTLVLLPESESFRGSAGALSLGARIGIVRESFTLPGVSVSVAKRFVRGVGLGDPLTGTAVALDFDPSVTSIRAAVSKDLFALGLVAGLGWDDYASDVTMLVTDAQQRTLTTKGELRTSRSLVFGGAYLNFVVLQLAAELGWARGLSAVPGFMGAAFDPTGGTVFGSLSVRLTI